LLIDNQHEYRDSDADECALIHGKFTSLGRIRRDAKDGNGGSA